MTTILDSSVIAKWYLKDEDQIEKAVKFRNLHVENKITISAPSFLILEIGNVFVSRKLNQQDFDKNIEWLANFRINFVEPDLLTLMGTFSFAKQFHLSFYDASYVALAKTLKCNLITADKKLVEATKKLGFVKLL